MAEKKDPGSKKPLPRKQESRQEPHLSHVLDDNLQAGGIDEGAPKLGSVVRKHKEASWFKKNSNVLILAGGVVVALSLLLVLGWRMGWFGGGGGGTANPPALAGQPSVKPASPGTSPAPQPVPVQTTPQPGQPAIPASSQGVGTRPPVPSVPQQVQPATPQQPVPQDAKKKEEPKKPALPEDVAQWKKQDYFRARKENDPKLIQAVVYLGQKFIGSEKSAQGLTDLLKPLPAEKPAEKPADKPADKPGSSGGALPIPPPSPIGSPTQPNNPGDLTKLVEAIVEALGCNGSPPARNTLEQILAGALATDDDKAAVEATVKTLAAHPCEENDGLLLRVLTSAEALRPADHEGQWPAKDLQPKALEWVKAAASFGLRMKLADGLLNRPGGFDPKDPIGEFLLASDPRNCGAQIAFYKRADTSKEIKAILEPQFLDYGSKALARCLGISDDPQTGTGGVGGAGPPLHQPPVVIGGGIGGPQPGPIAPPSQPAGDPAKAIDVKLARQVAGQLWSDGFCATIEPQLSVKFTLEHQAPMLVLAGTIPRESTRTLLTKILQKRWSEGPKALETAGLLDKAILDPGFLVALKLGGPRKDSQPTSPPPAAALPSRPGRPARPVAPPAASGKGAEATKKKQETEQAWMDLSFKLVDGWRKRLYAAALAREKAEAKSGRPGGDAAPKLPEGFELGAEAAIKAAYRLSWPDDAPPEIAQLDLGRLEVYYIRAEESNKVKRLRTFYATHAKIKASEARLTDDGKCLWIDSLRTAVQKDRRRSLDVLISRTSGGTGKVMENNDDADFLIEALIVEVKEPLKE